MKMISVFLLLLIVVGCSYRGVYESIQVGNRNECSKLPPSQYDECIEKASKSYDEYERDQKEVLGK
jgi:hypothetical protein